MNDAAPVREEEGGGEGNVPTLGYGILPQNNLFPYTDGFGHCPTTQQQHSSPPYAHLTLDI